MRPRIRILVALCSALLSIAHASVAGSQVSAAQAERSQKAFEDTKAFDAEARSNYNAGVADEAAGRNAAACNRYKSASAAWAKAIGASMGMMGSPGNGYDLDVISKNNDRMLANSEIATRRKEIVCAKPDGGAGSSASPASSSGTPSVPVSARLAKTRTAMRYTVVPHIKAMAPFVGASQAERAVAVKPAFYSDCRAAWDDAHGLEEKSATRAVQLCLALAHWLDDAEASTCLDLAMGGKYFREFKNDDPEVANAYAQAGLDSTEARLSKTVGCQQRDRAYWSRHLVQLFNSFPNYQTFTDGVRAAGLIDECQNSGNLAGAGYLSLADLVVSTCYSARDVVRGSKFAACDLLKFNTGRLTAKALESPGDPLVNDLPGILATIKRLQAELKCRYAQ